MNRKLRGTICVLIGGISWGFSGTMGQYLFANNEMDSTWLTMVRMILAGIILLCVGTKKEPKNMLAIWKEKKDAIRLLLFAVFGLMFCQYTYLTTIFYSDSATATALQYVGQVFILIYVCVQMRRFPTKKEGVAVVIAFSGMFLLTTHGRFDTLVLSKEALFWGIGAAIASMLYTVLPGTLIKKYSSIVSTGYGMLIGGLVLALCTGTFRREVSLDLTAILGVAIIVFIGTAFAFAMYLQGVSDLGAVKASLLACTEPITATILAAVWLKHRFAIQDLIGITLMIIMVMILAVPEKKKQI